MASTPAPAPQRPVYFDRTFETFYEARLQEQYAEYLLGVWGFWSFASSLLIAATTTGSSIAGFALWKTNAGHGVWISLCSAAAFVSLLTSGLQVPQRLKDQSELRTKFLRIRLQLYNLCQDMAGLPEAEQQARFEQLRAEYNSVMEHTQSDFFLTESRRSAIQIKLDDKLRERGAIQ